jgi:HAUS augmin-like complex subunit 1
MNTPPRSDLFLSPFPSPADGDITHLLSPSKARLLAAESSSWTHVTTHLTRLFHPSPIPPFERNPATLAALLSLIKANEDADAGRRIVHDARSEAMGLRNVEAASPASEVDVGERFLATLTAALPPAGQRALDDLASAAVLLGCRCDPEMPVETEMSTLITSLTSSVFSAENSLSRLQQTSRAFSRDEAQLQDSLARLTVSTDAEALGVEAMHSRTTAMNRETKVVGMKLGEYQDRIKALRGYDIGKVKVEDVVRREEKFEELQVGIRRLDERIINMQGLPPDLDVSRKEVERARGELEEWKRRRERAFEGLVE